MIERILFALPWWVFIGAALAGAWNAREEVIDAISRRAALEAAMDHPPPQVVPLEDFVAPGDRSGSGEVHLRALWRRDIGLVHSDVVASRDFLILQSIRSPLVFVAVEAPSGEAGLRRALESLEGSNGLDLHGFVEPFVPKVIRAQSAAWGGRGDEPIHVVRPYFGDRRRALEGQLRGNLLDIWFSPVLWSLCFLIGAVKFLLWRRRIARRSPPRPGPAGLAERVGPKAKADPFARGPIVSLRKTGRDVR